MTKPKPYIRDRSIRLLIALIVCFGLYSLCSMAYTTVAIWRWLVE